MINMAIAGYARGHNFAGRDLISRIGRALCPRLVAKVRPFQGFQVYLDSSDISHLSVAEEVLVDRVYDFKELPFKPDVIMDCGAHIGLFTLLAASTFPTAKLVAFEPDPDNREWLARQIEANNLNVDLIADAVSSDDGEAAFAAGLGCASAFCDQAPQGGHLIRVKTVRLSRFILNSRATRLLLKLDVEGAEEMLLPDIVNVLPEECAVFLETHRGEQGWLKCSAILESHGFTVGVTRRRDLYVDGKAIRSLEGKPAPLRYDGDDSSKL